MKACLFVSCAIALLICLPQASPAAADPMQPAAYSTDAHGADAYRKNLRRLRSQSMVQRRSPSVSQPGSPALVPSQPASPASANEQIKAASETPDAAERDRPSSAPLIIEKVSDKTSGVSSTAPNTRPNISSKFSRNLTVIKSFQQLIPKFSVETSRDPYATIAAAQQRPSPLKGSNPLRRYKISKSLPRMSPSLAQAAIKRRAEKIKARISYSDTAHQQAIKHKIETAAESARAAILGALQWAEQTVHSTAEQIERL